MKQHAGGCQCCGAHPVYRDGYCSPCWHRIEQFGSPDPVTMSLNELLEIFRDYGISCGSGALSAMIREGKFPFAVGTKADGGRQTNIIFRRKAVEWLRENTGAIL